MTEGAFEARKWAWRQTKEGIIVSFLIQPHDQPAALALAPLGTIYGIGYREMPEGYSGEKLNSGLERPDNVSAPDSSVVENPAESGHRRGGSSDKPRRHFSELPRSQQAALACEDKRFQDWLICRDAEHAAQMVRGLCGVVSRADLDKHPEPSRVWDRLYAQYLAGTSQMAEER